MTHKSKILIVDNEPAAAELLRMTLGTHGYDVFAASTAEEALAIAKPDTDLVLLDVSLPDRDGLEVCHLLKTRQDTHHIPIIVLSRRNQIGDKIESFHLGADDFMSRPFDLEELFARVEAVLRRYHQDLENSSREVSYEIVHELRRIIDAESIVPYFQPIYLLQPMSLLGLEVLSRPQGTGLLANPEFLFKSALRYGFYYELEMIVWRKALEVAERVLEKEHLFLNCCPYLIESNRFHEVNRFFHNSGWKNKHVFLEITERSAMSESEMFFKLLGQYRSNGFNIAIDDVGGGFASLESVIKTKPEAIKIDRHIVAGVADDPYRRSMVKLIVAFCREHGILCIAEGIETKTDLQTLIDLGMPAGQGYYLRKPAGQIDLKTLRAVPDNC